MKSAVQASLSMLETGFRKLSNPNNPAARAAKPPRASPQRSPATWANQPTAGPPMVVEPKKAIDQKDITRPRIWGELDSWRMVLPNEV